MSRLLIRNARLVNEGQEFDADVLVANGRIEKIAGSLEGYNEPVEIDAQGQWLLPGMIDDQVHFREPGAPTSHNHAEPKLQSSNERSTPVSSKTLRS